MYFEVFLEIVLVSFAVFGLFSFVILMGELCFGSDEMLLAIRVEEAHVADMLELYVREARRSWFRRADRRLLVIIGASFATKERLAWLDEEKIEYLIVE